MAKKVKKIAAGEYIATCFIAIFIGYCLIRFTVSFLLPKFAHFYSSNIFYYLLEGIFIGGSFLAIGDFVGRRIPVRKIIYSFVPLSIVGILLHVGIRTFMYSPLILIGAYLSNVSFIQKVYKYCVFFVWMILFGTTIFLKIWGENSLSLTRLSNLILIITLLRVCYEIFGKPKKETIMEKIRGGKMGELFKCWGKGWKVWIMAICINLPYVILLQIIISNITKNKEFSSGVWALCVIGGFIFIPFFMCYVFSLFYKEE